MAESSQENRSKSAYEQRLVAELEELDKRRDQARADLEHHDTLDGLAQRQLGRAHWLFRFFWDTVDEEQFAATCADVREYVAEVEPPTEWTDSEDWLFDSVELENDRKRVRELQSLPKEKTGNLDFGEVSPLSARPRPPDDAPPRDGGS